MAGTKQKGSGGSRTVIETSGMFSRGMNTEISDIEDAASFTSDECNCVIRSNGSRSRRLGIDYEDGYKFLPKGSIDPSGEFAYTATEWTNVNNGNSQTYLVVQAGGTLFFYKNVGAPYSQEPQEFAVDLSEFAIDKTKEDYKKEICRFTQAYGGLFVCSKAVQPFFIESLDKPESSSETLYNVRWAMVSLGPWEDYNWCREYDAKVKIKIDNEVFLESWVVGRYLGGGNSANEPRRWVVKQGGALGTKVGRVPTKGQNLSNTKVPWNVYAMDSNTVIGTMSAPSESSTSEACHYLDGRHMGTAYICDDFYRNREEKYFVMDGKSKVIHKPTAVYYADLWNNHVPVGQTQTAKERTGLTAYAVSPYEDHWDYSPNYRTVTIPSIPLSVPLTKKSNLRDDAQMEYLVFVSEGTVLNATKVTIDLDTWTDKISHRDSRVYNREAYFSNLYRYSNKKGLVLQIRDFKGTPDMYKPEGANDSINLLQGENVMVRPHTLTIAHKYNLWNQGWQGDAYVDTDDDGKNDTYRNLIDAFYQDMENDPAYDASYPSNNLQWFVAKDSSTKGFTAGEVWKGNSFTRLRPANLLQHAFGSTPAPRGHFILDYFKQDRGKVSGLGEEIPVEYPRCPYVSDITTYAGRVFYLTGDTVLYSQVVLEDLSKAGNCYQEADPTAEEIYEIVETDGGMIQIPEIGEGIKLVHVGGTLAVIGSRSTYLISGGSENNFTATAYVGGAMQSYTSESPFSFVEAEGSVFYWSTVGVVQLVPGQGGLVSNVFSNGSIQTFYDNIPDIAKRKCRGFYDNATKEIWWLYPSEESIAKKKLNVFDRALVVNLKTSAWTPMSFATDPSGESTYPFVAGGVSLSEAFQVDYKKPLYAEVESTDDEGETVKESQPIVVETEKGFRYVLAEEPIEVDRKGYKSSLFICVDTTQSNLTFGVLSNLNNKDWASGDWKGSGYNYNSYLVSHPVVIDSPYYNKSVPYLLATFRRTEQGFLATGERLYPSACQGAVLWDWNVNGNNGKWDAQQELYRFDKDTLLGNKYITTKTRVYGSGRAFQVRLSSVENKAFDIENVGFQVYADGRI